MTNPERWLPEFPPSLRGFDLATLEHDPHSVFALSHDLRITYVNPAFTRFSADNGATTPVVLGSAFLDSIHGPLRRFYEAVLGQVMQGGKPWTQEYACHSIERFREYFQVIYPLGERRGVVVINSERQSGPMDARAEAPSLHRYRHETGFITQCSNCRRTLRADASGLWDWVPAWVANLPDDTSHTICPTCFDYYWKKPGAGEQGRVPS